MKIIEEWKTVLGRAWSMRMAYVIAALSALYAAVPYFDGLVSPRTMGATTAVLALLLGVLRILDQDSAALADSDAASFAAPAPKAAPPAPPDAPSDGGDA